MPETLTRAQEPALTPPPSPAAPPEPSGDDRGLALILVAYGTPSQIAAACRPDSSRPSRPDPAADEAYFLAELGDPELARSLAKMTSGLAAETAARDARVAAALAALDAEGHTPETARAALGLPEPPEGGSGMSAPEAADAVQAYDNATARWNNSEHEEPDATFESILAEELGTAT